MNKVQKGADGVYDFDVLVHEPRMVRVGGEEADVSRIPVAVTMALGALSERTPEEILEAAEADPMGEYERTMRFVSDVCVQSNPKMTTTFLMENLDEVRLTAFFKFVFNPSRKAAKAVEGEAKAARRK